MRPRHIFGKYEKALAAAAHIAAILGFVLVCFDNPSAESKAGTGAGMLYPSSEPQPMTNKSSFRHTEYDGNGNIRLEIRADGILPDHARELANEALLSRRFLPSALVNPLEKQNFKLLTVSPIGVK